MPSLTKIRSGNGNGLLISVKNISLLQGFVVKLFKKNATEGCNLVTVYHEGEYEDYNVRSVVAYGTLEVCMSVSQSVTL